MTVTPHSRREFLAASAALAGVSLARPAAPPPRRIAFILLADTHYLANRDRPRELDPGSRARTSRLVAWLNRLPGSAIPAAGGGTAAEPRGVIHAGDVIDSGDRTGAPYLEMQRTEWRAFEEDFGLTG